MAFPTIPTVAAGRVLVGTGTTCASGQTFPSLTGLTKNSGDLLIGIVCIYDGNSTNAEFSAWGGGFTEFGDFATTTTTSIGCAYKWSTGLETGTFTVTSADTSTNDYAVILISIPGVHATSPPEANGYATSTNSKADPGALTPSWGTEETLWIGVAGVGETSTGGAFLGTIGAPSGYSDFAETAISADAVGGIQAAVAFLQSSVSTENPGTFNTDTSNMRWGALTIGVRPTAGTAHSRTPTDTVTLSDRFGLNFLAQTTHIRRPVDPPHPLLRRRLARVTAGSTGTGPLSLNLSDTITLSEAIAKTVALFKGDTTTLSDTPTRTWVASLFPADTVTLSDAVAKSFGLFPADSIALSDVLSRAWVASLAPGDTINLSDVLTRSWVAGLSFTDTVTLSDALVKAVALLPADTLSLSDLATLTSGKEVSLSDTITLSDAVVKAMGLVEADTTTLSDLPSRVWTALRGLADTVNLSDSPAKTVTTFPADTITLNDSLIKAMGVSAADIITLSDAVAKVTGLSPADSITLTEEILVSSSAAAQPTFISQAPLAFLGIPGGPQRRRRLTLAAQATIAALSLNLNDTVTLSEAVAKTMGVSLSDTIALSDVIILPAGDPTYISKPNPFLNLPYGPQGMRPAKPADYPHFVGGVGLAINLDDSITLGDTQAKTVGLFKTDTVTLSDAVAKGLFHALGDVVNLSDALGKSFVVVLGDVVTLTSLVSGVQECPELIVLSEGMALALIPINEVII